MDHQNLVGFFFLLINAHTSVTLLQKQLFKEKVTESVLFVAFELIPFNLSILRPLLAVVEKNITV